MHHHLFFHFFWVFCDSCSTFLLNLLPLHSFGQIFLQLCQNPRNVERLVETQELQCLIIGLTSLWDQTSPQWRHQASCVLKAVSSVPTNKTVAVAVFSFVRDTYHLNPALFIEFDSNNGYKALKNILKRCEDGVPMDQFQPVQDLLALIAAFTFLGKAELKVALCVTNPQPAGFKFDPPLTKGLAVKNLPAFHLLQASLLRSQDCLFCCQLLRTLQTIWEKDPANFFLLEWTVQSMAQLAVRVNCKPLPVVKIFFSMLEMVVFKLNYIPHETLRALLGVLKMVVHSTMLTEVLSDWGILELLLGELRRRAKILRKAGFVSSPNESENQYIQYCTFFKKKKFKQFSFVFPVSLRDLGMVPYIKIFLDDDQYRGPTLSILEQLAEINPDEFMSTAVGALCSSTQQELKLKLDLLQCVSVLLCLVKSVLRVLESPNSWDPFRKAGGFTGLLSLMVDMEGALADPPEGEVWKTLGPQQLLDLILLTLHIMALAVHLHVVNAHHFDTGGFYERLSDALLHLGCFHVEGPKWDGEKCSCPKASDENQSPGESFFRFVEFAEASATPNSSPKQSLPITLQTCIRLLSYLDHFATGTYSPQALGPKPDGQGVENNETLFGPGGCEGVILHPGAVRVIMTLLPHVFAPEDPQLSMEVQFSLAHHILAMVKSERNRQIMCKGGLVSTLLTHCRSMLLSPNHHLHLPVTCIFEKLSSQAISCSDFRLDTVRFWGFIFECALLQPTASFGSAISVHQIVTLVSITVPRTFRPHRLSSSPAFVEFDMSESGYGCLLLPSLATVKGVTADSISTGGIGGECRGFPPAAGLSFTCWFQINRFSSACDSHPIRLLSVVRHMSRTEQQYICLSVSFSAYDGCLVISTEEETFTYLDMLEPEVCTPTSLPSSLRFRCSSMLVPGQWHHLAVVMAKDVKKSCITSAYFNGKALGTGKMKYVQPYPGQFVSMDPTAVIDVYGLIGTPAMWKDHAALVWRVGPCHLFEEVLSSEAVAVVYMQGTAYLGNFLALRPDPNAECFPLRLVAEERISFGINPAISTLTSVVHIREDYNEVDCRLIAKEMGITSRDSSTPVFLLPNISKHLSGTARTIGAALIGHFGVRRFTPRSASSGFLYVGGPAVVLSLVAMAPDDSSLYAAIKVLLSVLETNSAMQSEMNRINGYKLLAFLLKMKSSLVSHRTFQLVMCLSSSVEMSCGTGFLQNTPAFQALLCDLEVWQNTPDSLDLSVLKYFAEILKSSSDGRNAEVMHSVGLLPKLLFDLSDPAVTVQRVHIISAIITSLLKAHLTSSDISRLGLFLVYTLPPSSAKSEGSEISEGDLSNEMSAQSSGPTNLICIRNKMLLVLCEILTHQATVFESLGSDWFLLFLQAHLHPSTLKLGLVLLTQFLSSPGQQGSFREGVIPGTLIEGIEEPFVIMDNLRAQPWSQECLSPTCPGFDVLQELLVRHTHLPQVYEALAAVLLGRSSHHTTEGEVGYSARSWIPRFATSIVIILALNLTCRSIWMTRCNPSDSDAPWEVQLTASVMQFLCLLHNLRPRDPLWASPKFLRSIAIFLLFLIDCSRDMPEGEMGTLMENVVLFSRTLLENLHNATFTGDSETLLDFLADQIMAVGKAHSQRERTVSALYSCTNKMLLHFLSQPRQSQEEKEVVIKALQTFMGRWDVFMATFNANVNFITCLLHCLLLIRSGSYPEGFGCVAQKGHNKKSNDKELVSLVEACWSKVLSERQHMLEESLKVEISASSATETKPVTMTEISPLWEEMAHKAWQLYTGKLTLCAQRTGLKNCGCECPADVSALDTQEVFIFIFTEPKILCDVDPEVKEDEAEGEHSCERLTFFPALNETPTVTEDCPDMRIVLQELHPGEKIKAKMCMVMVSGLRVTEGLLLFGNESLLLCEGFTLNTAGDVCCRRHHPSRVKDSFISTMLSKELPSATCRRWLYEDIKEARFMRFLLEDNAIEIFMKNGHSAFLVFLNKDHKGEMSNFEYLMHLNTIAGRTYNDLMQYPVFPWILADYQSETLDLSNPTTFRDLSKPMGAQTEKRKQMFIERYEEVENTGDMSARCHYCTHYSSAIIVASFLVRMEPFSHTFQALQGGFDIPERMFHSIGKEWESASRDNMGDVRELIPEFFYLPDFLLNSNHIQLGCLEDGTALGDVELPPWAKGDPQEFIRIHREALESDYVSSCLHLWIDLIFGHRQQGSAAVESVNTFHPYFYAQRGRQHAKDPMIKSTILGYVSNFGQIPRQLFTKPHPPRGGSKKDGSSPSHPTPFFFQLDTLKTSAQPTKLSYLNLFFAELPRGPVGQILCLEKEVLVVEKNRLLVSPPSGCVFSWGFPDNSCAFGNYGAEKVLSESLCDWGETLCAACPNTTTVITAGSSTVVCVWEVAVGKDRLSHMKLRQPLYGHTDAVTCLAVSEGQSLIVSGSRDLTCILWDLEELNYVTQLAGHTSSVSALAINDLTGEVVSCAGPRLYLWSMKGQLLACTEASCGPQADILCVGFTQRHEWDSRNVVVTGCADGVIRVSSPHWMCSVDESAGSASGQGKGWRRCLVLCRELSRGPSVFQRRPNDSPAVTALAMSRYRNQK
uniref:WDFY family member 4 n=1 Tax=Fundulus heteroclitus TaxID=8078 RepID=A0A3Q2NX03_FUNHE